LSLDEAVRSHDAALRQLSLDAAEDVDTVVANVDTERTLWLLYRVNVLDDVFVLAMEFRQLLLDSDALEPLSAVRLLRTLVGDAARRGCCCSTLPCPVVCCSDEGDNGDTGDFGCDGTGGGLSPMIKFETFVVRLGLKFEFECESDRELRAASPALFPNESFHLLGFFVTVGKAVGTGTGGGGGASGNDWTEAEAERV
jgi:hypothetical protein